MCLSVCVIVSLSEVLSDVVNLALGLRHGNTSSVSHGGTLFSLQAALYPWNDCTPKRTEKRPIH